jgi:two-component system, NtrC family, response regulator AtoC
VDSASLVGSLIESELFGYQKGGLYRRRLKPSRALVRAADGGTLFLDEIGELPVDVQAKLLRLLQEGEMRPIGGVKPVKVNVRILAATNRDLEAEVKAHRFRKDLFYRLNVITLRIPPLRERIEDIRPLVDLFIRRYAVHDVIISDEVMEVLEAYDWPGNVRELENTVRRLVALEIQPRGAVRGPALAAAQRRRGSTPVAGRNAAAGRG